MRSSAFEGYDMRVGETNIRIKKGEMDFTVSLTRYLTIRMASERKISAEALKSDIASAIFVLENVVNRVYYKLGKDFELDCRIRAVYPRNARSRSSRKEAIEEKIKFERSNIRFEDIGGCGEAKATFETLAHGLRNPQDYEKWGLRYPKGILLHGLPGTGKTLLAKAMATAAKATPIRLPYLAFQANGMGYPRKGSRRSSTSQRRTPLQYCCSMR